MTRPTSVGEKWRVDTRDVGANEMTATNQVRKKQLISKMPFSYQTSRGTCASAKQFFDRLRTEAHPFVVCLAHLDV